MAVARAKAVPNSSLRDGRLRLAMMSAAASAPMLVVFAPTAQATESEYLADMKAESPYVYNQLGPNAILNLGYQVCEWNAQGLSSTDILKKIKSVAPMSSSAAINVSVYAENGLGC